MSIKHMLSSHAALTLWDNIEPGNATARDSWF